MFGTVSIRVKVTLGRGWGDDAVDFKAPVGDYDFIYQEPKEPLAVFRCGPLQPTPEGGAETSHSVLTGTFAGIPGSKVLSVGKLALDTRHLVSKLGLLSLEQVLIQPPVHGKIEQ